MNFDSFKRKASNLKKDKSFENSTLSELQKLPIFNGIFELKFENNKFLMINTANDDAVPLKFFWRGSYEKLALKIWYEITREDACYFDIGAHTGIYTIVGSINKKKNDIISIEPYFLNFARLLSNLKLNKIPYNQCVLAAASDYEGIAKFKVLTAPGYHSSGGRISEDGNFNVSKIKIDNFNLKKKIKAIKIDTEGHELQILKGAMKIIKKNKPDIIFEINKNCFQQCVDLLKNYDYYFYLINEKECKLEKVKNFENIIDKTKGDNCLASVNKKIDNNI